MSCRYLRFTIPNARKNPPSLSGAHETNQALPISNHSSRVFSPCTIERTTGVALEKSENSTCEMFSLVQYVARSFSPSAFSFTNSTSACFAADRSGYHAHQYRYGNRWDPRMSYERRVPHLKRHLRRKRAVGGLQDSCTGGLLVTCRAQIHCGGIKSRTGGLNGEASAPTWKDDET